MRFTSSFRVLVSASVLAVGAVACGGSSHDAGQLGAARDDVASVDSSTAPRAGGVTTPPTSLPDTAAPAVGSGVAPAAVASVAAASAGTTTIDKTLDEVDALLRTVDSVLADTSDAG